MKGLVTRNESMISESDLFRFESYGHLEGKIFNDWSNFKVKVTDKKNGTTLKLL